MRLYKSSCLCESQRDHDINDLQPQHDEALSTWVFSTMNSKQMLPQQEVLQFADMQLAGPNHRVIPQLRCTLVS